MTACQMAVLDVSVLPRRARRLGDNRPWDYALKPEAVAARPTTRADKELVGRLQLDRAAPGVRVVTASLARVRERLRRLVGEGKAPDGVTARTWRMTWQERDRLRLVTQPGEALPTIVGTKSNVLWLGGPAMGPGRCMSNGELAGLMLVRGGRRLLETARRLGFKEPQLWEMLADSVYIRFAEMLVRNAMAMLAAPLEGILRYGSMCSGGVDAFFLAVREAGFVAVHATASEKVEARRLLLCELYEVESPFALMEEQAEAFEGQLSILAATFSCALLSKARRVEKGGWAAAKARARARLALDASPLCRLVTASRPAVLLLEQTDGLRTHHPQALADLQEALGCLPYVWRHGSVDAFDLGAGHHRVRLGWAGVRNDLATAVRQEDGGAIGVDTAGR